MSLSASATEPCRADSERRNGRQWIEFTLLMIVFFSAGGAPAPHVNETHYLLKAKHYWDPSFCPGDMFLNSADAHLPFYWTVGWLTMWLPLSAVAWVGRSAAWALLAVGWSRLTRAVTDAPWAAAMTGLLWIVLVDVCDFAGEWVVGGLNGKGGVEGKCFAYGFVLLGLAALAGGRWTAPWIWFGAASAMHVLVGGWAVVAGLGVWLTEPRASRPNIGTVAAGLFIGGALALPGLLPALALDRNASPAERDEAAQIYVYERLPHHLAPATLPAAEFRSRSVRFGAVALAMAVLSLWLSKQRSDAMDEDRAYRRESIGRVMRFATMTLIMSCVGLAIELSFDDRRDLAARWLRFYWFREADILAPLAVALGAACWALNSSRRRRIWARLAVGVGLLACSGHLVRIAADRWRNPYPPAVARMDDVEAWLAACEWIRVHAPRDAVCLIPRHAQSFKWYAQRADLVNWKDVPQDAVGVVEWSRRLHDIFPTVSAPQGPVVLSSPEQWGMRRVVEVARRYGANYVVARSEPPLGLRELYAASSSEGRGYAVYEVPADPATDSP